MKRKIYSLEQIIAVLKQAEMSMPVAEQTRQKGITEQTFYLLNKKYAELEWDQVRELKQVLDANTWLKKLVAELSLHKSILQDVLSKNTLANAHERSCGLYHSYSKRRACK